MSPEQLELLLRGKNPASLADDLRKEYQSDNPNKPRLHDNSPVPVFWPDNADKKNVTNATKK